ncbi:regulator of G-protein signaling 7-like isoform X1 [Tachypleus tridentatus]|uniref:regulator of G-protein signaling 7-like isoform X1 n=1 Tax=Tachypleus tridentatus TaxID=6853 RepID=UPI003FD33656
MTRSVKSNAMDQSKQEDVPRELVFSKMERLIREMQNPEAGVPVRSQKSFLTSIPCAFMGYDIVEWLMDRLDIEDIAEAIHIANILCQHGYFFPVNDTKFALKDDSTLYRFQTPYFWPSNHQPDNTDYAIFLMKRTLKNKQKHGLEDYEQEALARLKKLLCHKWEFVCMQAEEQINLAKERKKTDKIVLDSQEKAYWRVHRPPPGIFSCLERSPVANKQTTRKAKTKEELKKQIEFLKQYICKPRTRLRQVVESLIHRYKEYADFDPFISGAQPSNPWISDDTTLWNLNNDLVEIPTEKRVKRWSISLEELLSDPTGVVEFEVYLRKEYSFENIRFWKAVQGLKHGSQTGVADRVKDIYEEFLASGAPCEVNLDSKTVEVTQELVKNPSRYTFDAAQEHVFSLMKKDSYPRFLRSEHYKNLIRNAQQTAQKKKFFNFGAPTRKKSSPAAGTSKRRNSGSHMTNSTMDLTLIRQPSVERPFTGKHSHSTSDLQDLETPSDKLSCSRLSSPSVSRDRVNDTGRSTLQVPRGSQRMEHSSSSLDETSSNLSLAVPRRTRNLVAPWELED